MKNRLFLVLFTLLFYFALTSTVMADADCSLPGGCTTSLTITNKSPSVPILYDGTNDWASPGNIGNYFDFTAEFREKINNRVVFEQTIKHHNQHGFFHNS